jgi:hypothetical protein
MHYGEIGPNGTRLNLILGVYTKLQDEFYFSYSR